MLVEAHCFNLPLSERIMLAALRQSEIGRMITAELLMGVAGIITALGSLIAVFVKYRRGRAEIHDLRVQRNTEIENYLFARFQGELRRMDERLERCEKRHNKCEEDYQEALREIKELKEARARRTVEIAELKAKVDAIESTTSGFYLKLKE